VTTISGNNMEVKPMQDETRKALEDAVRANAKAASREDTKSKASLRYTQAALNAAHALQVMKQQ